MTIQEVIKKIDRYLKKDNVEPLIVDVQNKADLDAIMLYYKLPQNVFLRASDTEFCKADEFPIIPNILERLANENNSQETQISHVLQAIELKPELAKGTIRLSFGRNNSENDVDIIVESLQRILG